MNSQPRPMRKANGARRIPGTYFYSPGDVTIRPQDQPGSEGNKEISNEDLDLHTQRDDLEYAKLVSPLNTYINSGGNKHHREEAKLLVSSLRSRFNDFHQCVYSELDSKTHALAQLLKQEKARLEEQKGYYDALKSVEQNFSNYTTTYARTRLEYTRRPGAKA